MESQLRDLSRRIKALCESHMAYSQVVEIIQVACDHIDAMAYIEEVHRAQASAQSAHGEGKEEMGTANLAKYFGISDTSSQ